MLKNKFLLTLLTAFTLVFILAACSSDKESDAEAEESGESSSGDSFYDGEELETVVPYDAGGGSDVLARYVAPFLSDHVEGNPATQVVNIPGAGSVIGMNEYENLREPDGYNAVWSSGSTILNHLLETDGIEFGFTELTPILGVPAGGVVFISADTGYQEPKDILDLDESLVYSGQSATGLDLVPLIGFEVLDLDVQSILGYEGSGPARVAFEQGESNLNYQTTAAYLTNVQPLVDDGDAIPLFSFGHFDTDGNIIRDPAFPDIPNIKEFYEEVYGGEPSGEEWDAYEAVASRGFTIQKILWTKKDAPDEAIKLLQEGAEGLASDDEFIEKGDEVLGGYEPVVGDELVTLIENTIQKDLDPGIKEWIFTFIGDNFGE